MRSSTDVSTELQRTDHKDPESYAISKTVIKMNPILDVRITNAIPEQGDSLNL